MSDLAEKLREIRDRFKGVSDIAENVGDGNPPSQAQLDDVTAHLDSAERDLAIIHNSQQSPLWTRPVRARTRIRRSGPAGWKRARMP